MSATVRVVRRVLGAALGALLVAGVLSPTPAQALDTDDALYLVTLTGPGLAARDGGTAAERRMHSAQDRLLDGVGAGTPVYRWTHALNGFAVRLDPVQASRLRREPRVALVEANTVRPLAAAPRPSGLAEGLLDTGRTTGGAGVVVGVVDTGISPDHPLFAPTPGLGRAPADYRGRCQPGHDWTAETCQDKLVGAAWFVDGFGTEELSSSARLSAHDDDGHGTQVASIAAGNATLPVRVDGEDLGEYAGLAPQARVAAYKACWTAPDPADDGCATADLVSAVDRATADGVDVLNLSVGGPSRATDTLSRALLGATEGGAVVIAAAGNEPDPVAGMPWATTVGGAATTKPTATLTGAGEELVTGVSASTHAVTGRSIVLGARAAAPGADRSAARFCIPGSLDAGRVAGRVVLCERGRLGRVDKSRAVGDADGVGMVLVNRGGVSSVDPDLHAVPTIHLDRDTGAELRRWALAHPRARVRMTPSGPTTEQPRPASWSPRGVQDGPLSPDLIAPGSGLLGGVPQVAGRSRWEMLSGTSAAAAYTSGIAAQLLGAHEWDAETVRSALATTTTATPGPVTRVGAGLLAPERADDPGLVVTTTPGQYRGFLTGRLDAVNTPSVLVEGPGRTRTASRRVTHLAAQARYYSVATEGFRGLDVQVTPQALRLAPGEPADFTITVRGRADRPVGGYVIWRGATGTTTRIPVSVR